MNTEATQGTNAIKAQPYFWPVLVLNVLLSIALTVGHAIKSQQFLDWREFVNFNGPQPFQSRVLVFLFADLVSSLRPLGLRGLALLFMSIDLLSTVASFFFLWKAWCALGQQRGKQVVLFSLFWWQLFATFVVSPVNNYYYPYDMLSLAFMSLSLWLIVSRKPISALLVTAVIAMANRETSIVIPFFYLAFNWPASRSVWRHFLMILVACVAVKMIISSALHVGDDVVSLYHAPGLPRIFHNFAFLWLGPDYRYTLNAFFAFGFAWILLLLPGRSDAALRRMMYTFIPFLLGMVFVGNLHEIRIFAEFIPLLSVMLAGKFSPDPQAG